jgi:hypothetical protein
LAFAAAPLTPPGETGPLGLPARDDLLLWSISLLAFLALVVWQRTRPRAAWIGLSLLAALELGLAGLVLPLNHLTAPDAYSSIRPAMTELLAARDESNPPGRFLSLSALEFDPGDLAELHSEWDSQLPADAVYDAIVATKLKEVLSPNLPLTWNVPAVDGYDGGILPLRSWAGFARQFGDLPAEPDGRLRQFLKNIPPNWLLSLTNTRWIITDKTGDAWVDDIFYDLGQTLSVSETLTLDRLPPLEATHLGLVLDSPQSSGAVQVTLADGQTLTRAITPDQIKVSNGAAVIRLGWGRASKVRQIVVFSPDGLILRGASLIDARTGSFQSITLGPYRLAHSGDVKIYENLNVLPRAFLLRDPPGPAGALTALPAAQTAGVTIKQYEAEHVVIDVQSDAPATLVLTDADYPGWMATLDGAPVPIQTDWGLFRSAPVAAGHHRLEFKFEPRSVWIGGLISALALVVWLIVGLGLVRKEPARSGRTPALQDG